MFYVFTKEMSSEIVSYAVEYKNVIREIDALNNDIKKLRERLKPRLNELQKEKEKYEKIILQYLEKQQDPGFKYQDIVLYKEPKKMYPHRKERDDKLNEFLQQHNITDSEVVSQLKSMMKTKRIIDESRFTLKMKKLV
jgi:cupin superfamily acireductone dioxygenase involved in methionine salvage